MDKPIGEPSIDIEEFLRTGLDLKNHLGKYLDLSSDEINGLLKQGSEDLAALHPGSFEDKDPSSFYEKNVGTAHLFDLASWHLESAQYISETLRLLKMFAHGNVLDFGGGIGTHALFAAALPVVKHVWFVDLNPQNREFVKERAESLGLQEKISFYRDINEVGKITFDFITCLDVLEHIPDPSSQLTIFCKHMSNDAKILLNWYFFKGFNSEYPFHYDDPKMIEEFFLTLQTNYLEVFHPLLITARIYKNKL